MNPEKAKKLGQRIKADRQEQNLTQLELAIRSENLHKDFPEKYATISISTVKNIEGARRKNHTPRAKTLITIAKILGKSEDEYLSSIEKLEEAAIEKKAKELLYEKASEYSLDTPTDEYINNILLDTYNIDIIPFIRYMQHLGFNIVYAIREQRLLDIAREELKNRKRKRFNEKIDLDYKNRIQSINNKLLACPAPADQDTSNFEYDDYYELIAMLNEEQEKYNDYLRATSNEPSAQEIQYQANQNAAAKLEDGEDTIESSPLMACITYNDITQELSLKKFLSFANSIETITFNFFSI